MTSISPDAPPISGAFAQVMKLALPAARIT